MSQKERILNLVKEGLITAEEALVLLENEANASEETPKTFVEEPKESCEDSEDWKEAVNDTVNQVTEKVTEASAHVTKFAKKTLDSVNEHLDWTDLTVKVPHLTSTKFTHQFNYSEAESKVVDLKVFNGDIIFKNGFGSDLKIDADIKIYGKVDPDENPLELFLERSTIETTDGTLTFQIPSKLIRCNLVVYLPQRDYEVRFKSNPISK